jgi:NAD(P)-dependent dehydrogenase (short-subunit alcohol dehydrogenase family)
VKTRRAVVTGAASGIGAATVQVLRERGWDVRGIDLNARKGIVQADVSDADTMMRAAAELGSDPLDAVIAAAGIWDPRDGRHSNVPLDVWERTWSVNVTGTMLTLRTLEKRLRAGSSFVTVGSVVALAAMPGRDAYTASKGAIVALTRAWAADLIRKGIRVNCVCPGPTSTPMTEAALRDGELQLPLGRAASAVEVASVIVGIVDLESSYLNGAVIPVDGGLSSTLGTVPLTPR